MDSDGIIASGRWTAAEHGAFIQGLQAHGPSWRAIHNFVPTRTLIQIRTHAQKYFTKIGVSVDRKQAMLSDDAIVAAVEVGNIPSLVAKSVTHGAYAQAFATLRHVALEPVHAHDDLGVSFYAGPASGGHAILESFQPVIGNGFPFGAGLVEQKQRRTQIESAMTDDSTVLLRVGDVLVGVSGVLTAGLSVAQINTCIAAARAVTPAGCVVLHLCELPVSSALVDEAEYQCQGSAAQLLGSLQLVLRIRHAIVSALASTSPTAEEKTPPQSIFMLAGLEASAAAALSGFANAI